MRLLIMGPPGAGKGTQAARIAEYCNVPHISTGDIFRAAIKAGTELGMKLKGYLDAGQLVPDAVTIEVIKERLKEPDCSGGFLLDGFPRTIPQAEALDRMLGDLGVRLSAVLNIAVSPEALLQRLTGRRICRKCGTPYHVVFNPPAVPGVCDRCGGELYQRSDDSEETVRERLEVYTKQTAPVLEYYRKQGLLKEINGELDIEDVWKEIQSHLRSLC
ncbi:MAG TPA: adenylate kinase [Syntrophomonadaceae bacterium]|nr:adenylate kinase [Syntrophomonadaceae bacterium]